MSADFWVSNLIAYWLQIAAIAGVGFTLAAASRLRTPGAIHAYWQGVLAASATHCARLSGELQSVDHLLLCEADRCLNLKRGLQ